MANKKYIASADNTISNALQMDLQTRGTGSNMGAADILEAFYIFGQVSEGTGSNSSTSEKSRILLQFDIDKINQDRSNNLIPASGNVAWHLNLYNAPHSFTLPKDFKMVIKVCSGSWQEGNGLDMENYTDQTYESTGSNWVRKGATGDGYSTWLTEGGDFAESALSPAYTASFADGTENLSVDISNIVEDWMTGGAKAAGAIVADNSTVSNYNTEQFTLTDSQGTSITYAYDTASTVVSGSGIGLSGVSNRNGVASKIETAVNSTPQLRISAVATNNSVALTMDDLGLAGNTDGGLGVVNITSSTDVHTKTDFQNGTGIPNFGLGVFLSASFETGSHSYYTKKFFSRSSEYFFLRPNLEARWDDSKKDDAGHFVQSSSLATADDNINTLFLYNYVKGKLQNIPANPNHTNTSVIYASIYSSSVGNIYDKVPLPVGGGVKTTGFHNVTGGIYIGPEGAVTGVYTASFAMSHSLSEVYPVWHYEDEAVYHTGSKIDVGTINASNHNPNPKYLTTVENIKPLYSRKEKARFRLFVRERNWNPNNYTVMNSDSEGVVIEDAYYSVYRTGDNYVVIPCGTGSNISPQITGSSDTYTRMSYDISGNYFDLDMSQLQSGYQYGMKFTYYINGSYREQEEIFKFKVGD